MHEFGIAQGLLETVLAKAEECQANRIISIKLEIGRLAGIEQEALKFAFSALSDGTSAEHAALLIDIIPVRCHCNTCQSVFECQPSDYECPKCGEVSPDVRTGMEMSLMSMEVA